MIDHNDGSHALLYKATSIQTCNPFLDSNCVEISRTKPARSVDIHQLMTTFGLILLIFAVLVVIYIKSKEGRENEKYIR